MRHDEALVDPNTLPERLIIPFMQIGGAISSKFSFTEIYVNEKAEDTQRSWDNHCTADLLLDLLG